MAFDSWKQGKPGEIIAVYEDTVLKARWKKAPSASYTVSFHANGGTGYMEDQEILSGEARALNKNTFVRKGYAFRIPVIYLRKPFLAAHTFTFSFRSIQHIVLSL